jgi:hypothetical protein
LLAVQHDNKDCKQEVFLKIKKDVEILRNELFMKDRNILKQLRLWAHSNMWVEGKLPLDSEQN